MNWQDTILSLDDNTIKLILQEISFNTLAKALLKSDEKTRRMFYKNLHIRHKAMLEEGIEYAEDEGLEEAQEQVLILLKNLAQYTLNDNFSPRGFETDNSSGELDLDTEDDEENNTISKQEAAQQLFLALREAAELGNAQSCFRLGFCYDKGLGVEKDKTKAAECYAKAAELGYTGENEK